MIRHHSKLMATLWWFVSMILDQQTYKPYTFISTRNAQGRATSIPISDLVCIIGSRTHWLSNCPIYQQTQFKKNVLKTLFQAVSAASQPKLGSLENTIIQGRHEWQSDNLFLICLSFDLKRISINVDLGFTMIRWSLFGLFPYLDDVAEAIHGLGVPATEEQVQETRGGKRPHAEYWFRRGICRRYPYCTSVESDLRITFRAAIRKSVIHKMDFGRPFVQYNTYAFRGYRLSCHWCFVHLPGVWFRWSIFPFFQAPRWPLNTCKKWSWTRTIPQSS